MRGGDELCRCLQCLEDLIEGVLAGVEAAPADENSQPVPRYQRRQQFDCYLGLRDGARGREGTPFPKGARAGELLGPLLDDIGPGKVQGAAYLPEEIAAPFERLGQYECQRRAGDGQGNTRETGARADIDGRTGEAGDERQWGERVEQVAFDPLVLGYTGEVLLAVGRMEQPQIGNQLLVSR